MDPQRLRAWDRWELSPILFSLVLRSPARLLLRKKTGATLQVTTTQAVVCGHDSQPGSGLASNMAHFSWAVGSLYYARSTVEIGSIACTVAGRPGLRQ